MRNFRHTVLQCILDLGRTVLQLILDLGRTVLQLILDLGRTVLQLILDLGRTVLQLILDLGRTVLQLILEVVGYRFGNRGNNYGMLLSNQPVVRERVHECGGIDPDHQIEVTNEMLLGTIPATVTVLAIVRLRVCLCKGDASKLVSKRFVVAVYSLEVLGSIFLWVLLQTPELFMSKDNILDNVLKNETEKNLFISLDSCYEYIHLIHSSVSFYKWGNIFLCYILPLFICMCIYFKIIVHVNQSASRVQMHSIVMPSQATSLSVLPSFTGRLPHTRVSNGNKTTSNIQRSVLGIVVGIMVSWGPICALKIISLISRDNISHLYRVELHLMLATFVLFPFEEGILQSDKRKRICFFFKRIFGKSNQINLHGQVRHGVILIPEMIESGVSTIMNSLQENGNPKSSELLGISSTKLQQHTMTSEKSQRASIDSFESSSTSSLFSRRRGLMVPSLRLSTSTVSDSSSVFIISTPSSVDQHSTYLSSNASFSPLFFKVNRGAITSTDSFEVGSFTCTPYSLRTFSFGSTLSYDCQSPTGSGRTASFSRARSKWRSFQRKVSSSLKYNVS
ncbi:uncharacterized protein LOC133172098 [Saccostrea echinata]|uniref:uncharacterized protein LOC133172098 n=1 Tax=Saccostrea echinata TaxID=191078 RepID=UPI002A834D5A|nr:uncharacterized protein LOC133172098 [Saccostrea echinata]